MTRRGFVPRLVRGLSLTAWFVGAIVLFAGVVVPPILTRDAVLAQRVIVDKAAADLFGDGEPALTPIGSPQRYLIRDNRAFLPRTGPDGLRYLDEAYLQRTGEYPWQAQTVTWAGRTAVQGAGILLVLGGLGLVFVRRGDRATIARG